MAVHIIEYDPKEPLQIVGKFKMNTAQNQIALFPVAVAIPKQFQQQRLCDPGDHFRQNLGKGPAIQGTQYR